MPTRDLPQPILPPATLGVFGGGQLGAMFIAAAQRLGYRTIVFCSNAEAPAVRRADRAIIAPYTDEKALATFAADCDAVTLEFENVPVQAVALAAQHAAVRPSHQVLHITQNRLAERSFLVDHHFLCAAHMPVTSADDAYAAAQNLGTPCVLKTAESGYDGRGQVRIDDPTDAKDAWHSLGQVETLCEAWVDYHCELSVLVARNADGQTQCFGPIENQHENHILDLCVVPANIPDSVAEDAKALASEIAHALDLHGLICVEMFLLRDNRLLVNELAPRPHNSGHLTIEACDISQFELQVRAMCNLPLAPMNLRSPAAMVNLLGDLWEHDTPDWSAALSQPNTTLHLYGKAESHPGRKMGHITACASTPTEAARLALRARNLAAPDIDQLRTACTK